MKYTDAEIVQRIREGDLETYGSIFKEYYKELFLNATKYVQNADIAEEIVQELFYKLWKMRSELIVATSLKAYLYKAIQNNCLQFMQHQAVEHKYQLYQKGTDMAQTTNDPSEELKMKEIYGIVLKTFKMLPVRTRAIFRLSRFEGLKYREIANQLDISVKTVEANMGAALKLFRENLKDYTD